MSILRLKKCAIIAVNTIMSIWLIWAILFFVKTEHGKPILSDHIEDVKALIYILDTFEYIALFSFAYILVLLYMLINTYTLIPQHFFCHVRFFTYLSVAIQNKRKS